MRSALWNRAGLYLFVAVWLVYSVCPPFLSYDSYWTTATAVSLIEHGTTMVDRFAPGAPAAAAYGLECVPPEGAPRKHAWPDGCPAGGHWYNFYFPGTAVLAAPVMLLMKVAVTLIGPLAPRTGFFARAEVSAFLAGDLLRGRPLTELWCASTFGALAAWTQYHIALRFLDRAAALALALLFAFGTAEWSVASRNLYPHGLTVLLVSGALWCLLKSGTDGSPERIRKRDVHSAIGSTALPGRRRAPWDTLVSPQCAEQDPRAFGWAGLLLALSFTVRPSNAIVCAAIAAWVAIHRRKHLARFVLWAAPVAAVFFGYYAWARHGLLPLYVKAAIEPISPLEGAAMYLFSPSRGLLIYMPLTVVSLAGAAAAWRRRWQYPLSRYLIAAAAIESCLIFGAWQGHGFGPRYFADLTPLFLLFLIPAIQRWRETRGGLRRALAAGFLVLAAWGVFTNARGATSIAANQWSALPRDVNTATWRVWDWSDPQFLRGLK